MEHKKKEKSGVAHTIRLPSDSSHSRRLGSNEDAQSDHSPTPHYSRKLSTDYEFPSLEAMEVDIPQKSSLVDLTEDKILDPSPETNVKTEESNTQNDPSEPLKKTEISKDRSTGTQPKTVEKPQNSDPFSFVEGFLAQEKSAIPKTNSSKKPTKAEITAKKTNGHKEMSQSPSAINSKETRSGRNTTKNKPAQSLSDTANQRVTRGQRSRSRENKVTQDDSSSNKNNSSLPGKCAMEVNGEVTVVLSDSSDEGLNRRTKEEEFEISSSPVY